jgi:hypothetical protein
MDPSSAGIVTVALPPLLEDGSPPWEEEGDGDIENALSKLHGVP